MRVKVQALKNIQFRTQSVTTQDKCLKCGHPTIVWNSSERQYRVRRNARWSKWAKLPEAESLLQEKWG